MVYPPTDEFEPAPRRRWRTLVLGGLAVAVALFFIAGPLINDLDFASQQQRGDSSKFLSRRQEIGLIESETSGLRHLKPIHPVRVSILASQPFSKKISGLLATGLSNHDIEINRQEWTLSGLIPPATKVRSILTGGMASLVAGWYSNKEKRLFIRNSGQALGVDRWYIAHEYTHALQDQHFDLNRVQKEPSDGPIHNSDRYLAEHSLVEGDAVTIQYDYMLDYYSSTERERLYSESSPADTLPQAIDEQFNFPYDQGKQYVQYLIVSGGYRRVDAAFRHPPTTTFQIMFPGRSVRVLPVHLSKVLGSFRRWKVDDGDVDGAFGYLQLVEQHLAGSASLAQKLAGEWRGDRYVLIQKGKTYAMRMDSRWGDPATAKAAAGILEDEMAGRFGGLLAYPGGQWGGSGHYFGAIHVARSRIAIAFAHSAATARMLAVSPVR